MAVTDNIMKKLLTIIGVAFLTTFSQAQGLQIVTNTVVATQIAVTDYQLPPYWIDGFIQQVKPGCTIPSSAIQSVTITFDPSAKHSFVTNLTPILAPTFTTNVVNGTNDVVFVGFVTNGFNSVVSDNWYTGTNFNVHTTLR